MLQMLGVNADGVEAVRPERAVLTPLVPLRREHEVVDDELPPALEQITEGLTPVRRLEQVRLLDALPRQLAPPPIQLVARARELLLPRQQLDARLEPLVV